MPRSETKLLASAMLIWLASATAAVGQPITINFDVDASGNTINAPSGFAQTTHLTTLYSSLGVTFNGPGGNDGGAILNDGAGFGVLALTTPNFLAFNRDPLAFMADGGFPRDPEMVIFSTAQSQVSIFASGGADAHTFRMDAFDVGGTLIGTNIGASTFGNYVQLTVTAAGIRRIVLTSTAGDDSFVFDNLAFQQVPEPSTLLLVGAAALFWRKTLAGRRRTPTISVPS